MLKNYKVNSDEFYYIRTNKIKRNTVNLEELIPFKLFFIIKGEIVGWKMQQGKVCYSFVAHTVRYSKQIIYFRKKISSRVNAKPVKQK